MLDHDVSYEALCKWLAIKDYPIMHRYTAAIMIFSTPLSTASPTDSAYEVQ